MARKKTSQPEQLSEPVDPPPAKSKKASRAEVAQRVSEIVEIMLAGAAYAEVLQFATEKQWNLQERQLRSYMARAWKSIASSHERSRRKLVHLHEAQRRLLLNKTLEVGDFRTALSVLRDLADLQGLYPPTKVAPTDPSGKTEYGGGLSDEERAARIATILDAARTRRDGSTSSPSSSESVDPA